MRVYYSFLFVLLVFPIFGLKAQVRVSNLFTDNMVIQRNKPVKIWGRADKKEVIEVEFCGRRTSAQASKDGKWAVTFDAFPAGGPYELTVQGKKNQVVLKNILIGDVWICSGQSNMGMTVSGSLNAQEEIAAANYPEIRLFTVSANINNQEQEDVPSGQWATCSPESVGNFSAAGYFFGRDLYRELNIPIGLINSSVGGTNIEAWMSREAIRAFPEYSDKIKESRATEFGQRITESQNSRNKWLQALKKDQDVLPEFIQEGRLPEMASKMELPQRWEDTHLPGIDGSVWFQKEIYLSEREAAEEIELNLCLVDDADETYWNGSLVGATNGYNKARSYTLTKGIANPGKNVLSIKVMDGGGSGGIRGKCENFYYRINDHRYSLCGTWAYEPWVVNDSRLDVSANDYPSLLYNSKIAPLTHLAIKGALWYQGESNVFESDRYQYLLKAMITDWREKWGQDNFPFLVVQLANCGKEPLVPGESNWAELRESQARVLDLPNTGLAVAIDVGEAEDIHPKNKQEIGRRLSLAALRTAYGKDLVSSGPTYRSMRVEENRIVLTFDHIGSGLWTKDKYGYLKGFSIAGTDQKFVWARAYIKGDHVVVFSPKIKNPVAVRYAWANNPGELGLFNKQDLPAAPFRTDVWRK